MGILSKIVAKEIHADIPFPEFPEFIVGFKYCGVTELENLTKACSRKVYNPKTRTTEEQIDDDLFRDKIASDIITGWKGLTVRIAKSLLPVNDGKVSAESMDDDTIIEHSTDDAKILLHDSFAFKMWVLDVISDLNAFEQYKKEAEFDNLK